MSWYMETDLARAEHEARLRKAAENARLREARAVPSAQRRKRYAVAVEQLKALRQRLRRVPA